MSLPAWRFLLWVMLVLAAMFSAGLFFHVSGLLFFFGFAFLFLQDMTFYLNHFYLVVVLNLVYSLLPSNRMFSLDVLFGFVKPKRTVPYWTVFVSRYVISVVYIYAGVAKMNEDWIRCVVNAPRTFLFENVENDLVLFRAVANRCFTGCQSEPR
jgi:vitamin K-dependent gamma-carboxylase